MGIFIQVDFECLNTPRFWQFSDTQNRQGPYGHRAYILSSE